MQLLGAKELVEGAALFQPTKKSLWTMLCQRWRSFRSHALAARPVTIAEFDAFTDVQPNDTAWELVDGQIVAMTNPTARHGQITVNMGVPLAVEAASKGCRIDFGAMRVQAARTDVGVDKTLPDLTVSCGDWTPERTFITDPVIVVEILSPYTMDFDRGAKLDFYKQLPSMQDIVLVYQDQIRVEHYLREDEGWSMERSLDPPTAAAS